MKKKLLLTAIALTLLLTSCGKAAKYLNIFETVWQAVNDTYFDPTFGGLDWNEVHDRYQPLIATAENDENFYDLLNQMLFELNISHIVVLPPELLLDRTASPYEVEVG